MQRNIEYLKSHGKNPAFKIQAEFYIPIACIRSIIKYQQLGVAFERFADNLSNAYHYGQNFNIFFKIIQGLFLFQVCEILFNAPIKVNLSLVWIQISIWVKVHRRSFHVYLIHCLLRRPWGCYLCQKHFTNKHVDTLL